MDRCYGPVCHPVWRTFSRNSAMIVATGIVARPIMAWSAASPSSPAPSARRYAALGLDRSLQPSKLSGHGLRCLALDGHDQLESTFTEVSYTKLLTIPLRSGILSSGTLSAGNSSQRAGMLEAIAPAAHLAELLASERLP